MNPDLLGFVPYIEELSDVGEVEVVVQDLGTRWAFENERHRVYVTEEEAVFSVTWPRPVSPEVAWEYVTSPEKRAQWNQFGVDGPHCDRAAGFEVTPTGTFDDRPPALGRTRRSPVDFHLMRSRMPVAQEASVFDDREGARAVVLRRIKQADGARLAEERAVIEVVDHLSSHWIDRSVYWTLDRPVCIVKRDVS